MRLDKICAVMILLFFVSGIAVAKGAPRDSSQILEKLGVSRGICVVVGASDIDLPVDLARASELIVYVQSADLKRVDALREAAAACGLLGTQLYVEHGDLDRLQLATNLADGLIVFDEDATAKTPRSEILRVVHPGAKALIGNSVVTKPRPVGADDWSHPYHGPDNNPQSSDRIAKAPYLTQFLTQPWYVPMPQVTVTAGGRLFKAFGHIALKRREWEWLNSLVAINGYNGTHLWKRKLNPGFVIHRNTMVATPDTLYLGDDTSCKLIDTATGEPRGEIVIPKTVDPDGVWKWMAIEDGVLYAVVGEKEKLDKVLRGKRTDPGWPWRGLGRGYAAKYSWGFGRTIFSMDLQARKILWTYRSHEPIDSRAVCMANGRIFVYSHQNYLAAIDASSGHEIWKSEDPRALAAIGEHDRAQTASKGFASSVYAKANDKGVFFAGPQRTSLVAISATDGSLLWHYPHGNFQLILRDDALYAMGRMQTSKKLDYLTGEILADLDCYRGNCTRATGTADSIFTRGYRHTGTMRLDLQSGAVEARRIPLMRPACQDGVIVNEGQLYWGPWMCDCNHSLVGLISLAPAGSFDFAQAASDDRLESWEIGRPEALSSTEADWTSYRAGPQRLASSPVSIPQSAWSMWNVEGPKVEPTAPVTASGLIVWGARDGSVRACDAKTGAARWTTYTGGAIRFPPEIADGRVYVGSGDGWVYCLVMATGERLWRFRAAPAERKIAIHGRLLSTWPVGSGVLVADGVVYAAAGIASYDGTHVYALDAESGKIRWQNNTSGRLVREDLVTGVSVQGHLLLHEDRLYLAGGNIVSPAMYKLSDGACLNEIDNEWLREPSTTERFPSRPKGSMFQRSPRGRELFLVDGKVRVFDDLLYSPPRYQRAGYFSGRFLQASRGDVVIRGNVEKLMRIAPELGEDGKPQVIWENQDFAEPRALALGANAVVIMGEARREQVVGAGSAAENAGKEDAEPVERFLIKALSVNDGKEMWSHGLPARPVSWGLALDREGRAVVTLEDGRVLCFGS